MITVRHVILDSKLDAIYYTLAAIEERCHPQILGSNIYFLNPLCINTDKLRAIAPQSSFTLGVDYLRLVECKFGVRSLHPITSCSKQDNRHWI